MDLVNLVYRYVNKFINSNDLVKQLKNLDSEKYSKEEIEIIEKLILDIENIRENVPNEIDEIEKRRLDNIERMLALFEDAQKNFKDEKSLKIINEKYNQMFHEKEITKDGDNLYLDIEKAQEAGLNTIWVNSKNVINETVKTITVQSVCEINEELIEKL